MKIYQTQITRIKFTLIELLVVIGIIAILMTIMLPALKQARNRTKSLVCTNNQKQLGLIMSMYTNDYNGWTPASVDAGLITWDKLLYTRDYSTTPVAGESCIYLCPCYPASTGLANGVWSSNGRGYGMNGTDSAAYFRIFANPIYGIRSLTNPGLRVSFTVSASQFILLADTKHSNLSAGSFQWYNFWNGGEAGSAGHIHVRHFNTANCLFGDGHVESPNKQNLSSKYGILNYQ